MFRVVVFTLLASRVAFGFGDVDDDQSVLLQSKRKNHQSATHNTKRVRHQSATAQTSRTNRRRHDDHTADNPACNLCPASFGVVGMNCFGMTCGDICGVSPTYPACTLGFSAQRGSCNAADGVCYPGTCIPMHYDNVEDRALSQSDSAIHEDDQFYPTSGPAFDDTDDNAECNLCPTSVGMAGMNCFGMTCADICGLCPTYPACTPGFLAQRGSCNAADGICSPGTCIPVHYDNAEDRAFSQGESPSDEDDQFYHTSGSALDDNADFGDGAVGDDDTPIIKSDAADVDGIPGIAGFGDDAYVSSDFGSSDFGSSDFGSSDIGGMDDDFR